MNPKAFPKGLDACVLAFKGENADKNCAFK